MRTTEQQLHEILKRSEQIREKHAVKKRLAIDAVSAMVCIVLLFAVSASLPRLAENGGASASQHYGSLILGPSFIGYVIIGVLAFALGICVALFCVRWKELKQKGRKQK